MTILGFVHNSVLVYLIYSWFAIGNIIIYIYISETNNILIYFDHTTYIPEYPIFTQKYTI